MPVHVQRTTIAYGDTGVFETLQVMAHLIDGAADDPLTVGVARHLVVRGSRDTRSLRTSAYLVRDFLKRYFRFVDDPVTRELLRDSRAMLEEWQALGIVMGDCDEAAILGGSLGSVVGVPVTLTVLAFEDGSGDPPRYSHVYASLLPDGGPEVTLDVTRPSSGTPVPSRAFTIDV